MDEEKTTFDVPEDEKMVEEETVATPPEEEKPAEEAEATEGETPTVAPPPAPEPGEVA